MKERSVLVLMKKNWKHISFEQRKVIASMIKSKPSLLLFKSGAKPPSSPTPVESPFSFKTFFK